MKKTNLLKPILIYILINIFSIITFNIIESLNTLMINNFARNISYVTHSIITIFLYLLLHKVFLRKIPSKIILNSICIIILFNLILYLSGYLMMNYGWSEIMAENGQFPILIFIHLNFGFIPLIELFQLPELLQMLMITFISLILLYYGSRKYQINNNRIYKKFSK